MGAQQLGELDALALRGLLRFIELARAVAAEGGVELLDRATQGVARGAGARADAGDVDVIDLGQQARQVALEVEVDGGDRAGAVVVNDLVAGDEVAGGLEVDLGGVVDVHTAMLLDGLWGREGGLLGGEEACDEGGFLPTARVEVVGAAGLFKLVEFELREQCGQRQRGEGLDQ